MLLLLKNKNINIQTEKRQKTHLVVFFEIQQKQITHINPHHDTIENTYEKNTKITKKTTKIFHFCDKNQNQKHSIVEKHSCRRGFQPRFPRLL